MKEQAGIYKIELIENKDVSFIYLGGDTISFISSTGTFIYISNDENITLKFSPVNGKNNKQLYNYNLDWLIFDLSKENLSLINQIKKSIYGWLLKIEFYDKNEKVVTSPLFFNSGDINQNQSNSYKLSLKNNVACKGFVNYTEVAQSGIGFMEIGNTFIVS